MSDKVISKESYSRYPLVEGPVQTGNMTCAPNEELC